MRMAVGSGDCGDHGGDGDANARGDHADAGDCGWVRVMMFGMKKATTMVTVVVVSVYM